MGTVLSSKFIVWEGDTYRVDDIPDDGFKLFVLKGGVWVPASGKLLATVEFEGVPVSNPSTSVPKTEEI